MGTSFLKKTKIPNSEKKKKKGTIALENCFHSNPGRYVERPPPTLKIRGECYTCTTTSPPPHAQFRVKSLFQYQRYRLVKKRRRRKNICVVAAHVVHRCPSNISRWRHTAMVFSLVRQHFTIRGQRNDVIIDFHLLNCGMYARLLEERAHTRKERKKIPHLFCSSGDTEKSPSKRNREKKRWKPTDQKPNQQQPHITKKTTIFLFLLFRVRAKIHEALTHIERKKEGEDIPMIVPDYNLYI